MEQRNPSTTANRAPLRGAPREAHQRAGGENTTTTLLRQLSKIERLCGKRRNAAVKAAAARINNRSIIEMQRTTMRLDKFPKNHRVRVLYEVIASWSWAVGKELYTGSPRDRIARACEE